MKTSQIVWLCGLASSVCGALIGQAELLGEPTRHYVTVIFIVMTALSGYMLQRPSPWDGDERRIEQMPPPPQKRDDIYE